MKSTKKFLLSIFVLSLYNCGTVPGMQTARTIEPQTIQYAAGIGTSANFAPNINFGGTLGLTENIDISGRISLFGLSGLSGKYQFINQEKFAMAAGVGVAGGGIGSDEKNDSTVTAENTKTKDVSTDNIGDIYIFPILSYDFDPSFSIYTSPRIIFRQHDDYDETKKYHDILYKINIGAKIGSESGVIVEASATRSERLNSVFGELDLAYFWKMPDCKK